MCSSSGFKGKQKIEQNTDFTQIAMKKSIEFPRISTLISFQSFSQIKSDQASPSNVDESFDVIEVAPISPLRDRIAMFENRIIKPKTYAHRKIPESQSNESSLQEVRVDQSPLRSVEDTVKQLERSPIKLIRYVEPSDGDGDDNDVEWAREFKPYLNIDTSSKDWKEKSKLKTNLAEN